MGINIIPGKDKYEIIGLNFRRKMKKDSKIAVNLFLILVIAVFVYAYYITVFTTQSLSSMKNEMPEDKTTTPEQFSMSAQYSNSVQMNELIRPTFNNPGEWLQYSSPEEAGWSSTHLDYAGSYFNKLGSTALMVIYNGNALVVWGDVKSKIPCHSIRKSFLSALYGIYIDEGKIDINKTLNEIKIDDIPPLSDEEKKAKVSDLLKSRSGVYHTAASETRQMMDMRPKRGSHEPDTYWFYNNWDFNALGTIFTQFTGEDIFKAFKKRIAETLEMEDFDLKNMNYSYEKNKSIHPAYHFKMSTRDMARFGLLYLNKGRWNEKQVIPAKWIEESTFPYSDTGGFGYGYMWWITDDNYKEIRAYSAEGSYGNRIHVIPKHNLVIVHTVNSDITGVKEVSMSDYNKLLKMIIEAKTSEGERNPKLVPLK